MVRRVSYHGKVAVAAAAMTPLSRDSGRTVLSLAAEACRGAIEAAGIDKAEVNGVAAFSLYDDSVAAESVAGALGLRDLGFVMDFNQGGQSPAFMVMQAALALDAGLADAVLVYRALNGRSGVRVGRAAARGVGAELRHAAGLIAYPQVTALWARRYMIETGATELDMAAAAINARVQAARNPRALRRHPLDLDGYFASPMVADPYRAVDCTVEVDGACALLVTRLDRARDLRLKPAVLAGSGWRTHSFDLDMASALTYDAPSRNFAWHMKDAFWGGAGYRPEDADVASLYDCFSGVLLQNMEGMGLCGLGEAGEYLRRKARGGKGAVVNPSGGLLAEGYLHGMNVVAEAVWQVQGEAGPTQVEDCEVAVTCTGGHMTGSALLLARDFAGRAR